MTVAALAPIGSTAARQATAHRRPLAGVVVQLLAVARDQQQRVVGGRADHQDRQDALALPVEADRAVLGQREDDERGGGQAEHRGEQDGERQDRAAVDDQQDQEDHAERDAEQDAVDAAERGDEVGQGAAGAGDVDVEPGRGERLLGRRAQGGRTLEQHRGVAQDLVGLVGVELDRDEQRLAVLAGDRGGGRLREVGPERLAADGEPQVRHPLDEALHRRPGPRR